MLCWCLFLVIAARADGISCFPRASPNSKRWPTASECLNAIEMIPKGLKYPTGNYIVTHSDPLRSPDKPISLDLDKRRYVLPAAFRSNNCVVHVHAERAWRQPPFPPLDHDLLYYKLFPLAREHATEIVHRCLVRHANGVLGGMYMHKSMHRGYPLFFSATVGVAGDDRTVDLFKPKPHVYEASKPEDWDPESRKHRV